MSANHTNNQTNRQAKNISIRLAFRNSVNVRSGFFHIVTVTKYIWKILIFQVWTDFSMVWIQYEPQPTIEQWRSSNPAHSSSYKWFFLNDYHLIFSDKSLCEQMHAFGIWFSCGHHHHKWRLAYCFYWMNLKKRKYHSMIIRCK